MKKILIAAGGTGGHLFPAIAVTEKLKEKFGSEIDFIFFGRDDKLEGRIVPELGYRLVTTKVTGLTRDLLTLNSLLLPFRIFSSIVKLCYIIRKERIDAVLCAGAYLSYPAGVAASLCHRKLYLMESNINPGKTITMLANRADTLFATFDATARYFNDVVKKKIKTCGNPVRQQILADVDKHKALEKFGLDKNKPVVLIFGGSLGAKPINDAIINALDKFANCPYQVIWQTGSANLYNIDLPDNVKLVTFIDDMASAYAAADLVVSRSGATTVSELTIVGKASVLVPLPSASNNEQMFNAKYLESSNSALVVNNEDIVKKLFPIVNELMSSPQRLLDMATSAKAMGKPDAGDKIADIIKDELMNKEK
ncbi:MAG: undecaprenyldiphospho-muramoylpentapeptide beta-N-acetylglucosaminyltransferase [Ignavibacteria bacterium]|jgi:UDP-N-acetylglucosamine--N-acetylmuramyl-(pentapeptide) pyrophosphoryl-undecaprenol N-acetylglucosamine transferase|nr:undecaprenyldiphospho-muramoylpentapeptide beta-N-acetylglucosaminyltransferase [Ignavibacteria bacterium]